MTIQDIIQRISQNKELLGITLYPPATQQEIDTIANGLNISFPPDLITFYLFCNGFESAEDMFRIVPLAEFRDTNDRLKSNQICIAEYMIYCDYWVMTVNDTNGSYEISEGSYHTVLTDSFVEFVDRFLSGGVFETGGLYEWKDSIRATTKKPLK